MRRSCHTLLSARKISACSISASARANPQRLRGVVKNFCREMCASANDGAEFAVGFGEEIVGGEDVAVFVVHDDGAFYFAAGFVEEIEGLIAREAGEGGDDAGAAVDEFGIFEGVDVDHEVAVGFADLDHG